MADGQMSSWDRAGWLSKATFSVASALLATGSMRALQMSDLDELPAHDGVPYIADKLAALWDTEVSERPGNASLWRVLYRCWTGEFWVAALFCLLESVFRIAQPVLLGVLVRWLETDGELSTGYGAALGLVACSLAQAVVHHLLYYWTMRGGFNCRMAVSGLVHRKALRLSGESLERTTQGHCVNLLSNDVLRFDNFCPSAHFLWSAPLDSLAVLILIAFEVGIVPAFAGTSVILLFLPLQLVMGRCFSRQRAVTANMTDCRVRLASDIFAAPRTVKAFQWEDAMSGLLGRARTAERNSLFKTQLLGSVSLTLYFAAPCLSALCTFAAVWFQGETINVSTVFSTLSLIHVLRLSVGKNWTRGVQSGAEALTAVARLENFLLLEEVRGAPEICTADVEAESEANLYAVSPANVVLQESVGKSAEPDASRGSAAADVRVHAPDGFWWKTPGGKGDTTAGVRALGSLCFAVPRGSLVLVCAPCGAGKTALLKALLGELRPVLPSAEEMSNEGATAAAVKVAVRGPTAYAAQRPWIFSGSLRENVLFGRAEDEAKLRATYAATSLDVDIKQLVDGEQTEIGEAGVNLSGGQQARVSLARALYGSPRVVLLDDPLAAVDARVGRHIFHNLCQRISGNGGQGVVPQDSTVVLVTHHVEWLVKTDSEGGDLVDRVLVLGTGGECLGYGTPPEVRESGVLNTMIETIRRQSGGGSTASSSGGNEVSANGSVAASAAAPAVADPASKPSPSAPVELILPEARSLGVVSGGTYLAYLRAGGLERFSVVLFLFVAAQGTALYSDWYLKGWADQGLNDRADTLLQTYTLLTCMAVALGACRAVVFFGVGLRAATRLHDDAFERVLHAPLWWYTANPLGRILNKFTADMGQVDELLPSLLFDCVQNAMLVIGAVALCCLAIPWMLLVLVPLVLVFKWIRGYFLKSSRELKRLESISKSPVFAAFSAHIAGLDTIRSFDGASQRLHRNFLGSLDLNARCWYSWLLVNRWVGFRLDMLSLGVLTFVCIGPVVAVQSGNAPDPGLAGFAMTYAIALSGIFQYCVRVSARVETFMTGVERLLHYGQKVPREVEGDSRHGKTDSKEQKGKGGAHLAAVVDIEAPAQRQCDPLELQGGGTIEFVDVSVRYRHDLPLILDGITLRIAAGANIGVCGRTGSGKSSLVSALVRFNQIERGRVLVNGCDASRMPLSALRRQVAVIPQRPEMFAASLRFNVDPTGTHTDSELKDALCRVGLGQLLKLEDSNGNDDIAVGSLATALDKPVAEGGASLSEGERQLLSLARALLRRTPIVIVDEATANCDYKTDSRIQKMLTEHERFASATVLSIAHRLATILQSDQLLVLNAGRVVAFAPPRELLSAGDNAGGSKLRPTAEVTAAFRSLLLREAPPLPVK